MSCSSTAHETGTSGDAGQARLGRRRQEPAAAQLGDDADDVSESFERVLEDVEVVIGVLLDGAQAVHLGKDDREGAPHGEVPEGDRCGARAEERA
jgi:hypothetical protein